MKLEIPTDGKRLYTDYLIDSHGIIYNSKSKKNKAKSAEKWICRMWFNIKSQTILLFNT